MDPEAVVEQSDDETESLLPDTVTESSRIGLEEARDQTLDRKDNVRDTAQRMRQAMSVSYVGLGALLREIQLGSYYVDYGYDHFKEYCQDELGFTAHKARRLINIYETFVIELEKEPGDIVEAGWSKVSEIEPIVDEGNVDDMLRTAQESTLSEVRDTVKQQQATERAEDLDEDEQPAEREPEQVYDFEAQLYDEQIDVIEQALEEAEQQAESDSVGHLLTLICQDYLSGVGAGDSEQEMAHYLRNVEESFDVNVIALNGDGEQITYGADTLDDLVG